MWKRVLLINGVCAALGLVLGVAFQSVVVAAGVVAFAVLNVIGVAIFTSRRVNA